MKFEFCAATMQLQQDSATYGSGILNFNLENLIFSAALLYFISNTLYLFNVTQSVK